MIAPTLTLAERLAAAKSASTKQANAQASNAVATANAAAATIASATPSETKVFFAELPPAISYLTPTGKAVFFYQGFHVTDDKEVIDFCATLGNVQDVTATVSLDEVPRPEARSRQRNWASNVERTMITPAELLSRAVRVTSTADLGGNSAASNSGIPPQ
jgi:hypothetical protein